MLKGSADECWVRGLNPYKAVRGRKLRSDTSGVRNGVAVATIMKAHNN